MMTKTLTQQGVCMSHAQYDDGNNSVAGYALLCIGWAILASL